ncbi:MAG: hypothetical protein NVSMB59_03500 [Vulcanimicrobiaceae bacterium]
MARMAGFAMILLAMSGVPVIAANVTGPAIHPGDKIAVTVYNHPELSTTASVASDGSINVPLAGTVSARSATTQTLTDRVRGALKLYLKEPAVAIRVVQQGQTIFVTGAFVGVLPYEPGETVGSAIGALHTQIGHTSTTTGGIDPVATAYDLRSVRIEHDGAVTGPYDVEDAGRSGRGGPALSPGDRVMLANKPVRVDIRGDVKLPGPVYLYPGETLVQALDEAGGVSPTSSTAHVTLTRSGIATDVTAAGAQLVRPAQDGDIVTMHPAPRVNVYGMVTTPGETFLKSDTSLLSALYSAGGPNKYADLRHIEVVHGSEHVSYDISKLTHGDLKANPQLADGDTIFVPEGHKIDPGLFFQALGAASGLRHL